MASKWVSVAGLSAAILSLAACNPSTGSAPGAVSEGEAAALEEAAEMLDERRLPEGALPPIDGPPIDGPPIDGSPIDGSLPADQDGDTRATTTAESNAE
jgi:hypothetical protein